MDEKITLLEERISALETEIAELKKSDAEFAFNFITYIRDALSMKAWPEAWFCKHPIRTLKLDKLITIYPDGRVVEMESYNVTKEL